jgi:hypothetical protein
MRKISILLCLFVAASCSHKLTMQGFHRFVPGGNEVVAWEGTPKPQLEVLYLGSGHMIVKSGGEAFFTDPFFSIQPMPNLFLRKMKSDADYLKHWKQRIDSTVGSENVKTGLVSHSHYDHLMDLPLILDQKVFPKLNAVYGNPNMPIMLSHFQSKDVALNGLSSDKVYEPGRTDTKWDWITVSGELLFLPISTEHASQALGHLFMSGEFKPDYFEKHLTEAYSKVGNFKWTVGESYAFLVDIGPENNKIRLYIQTSASGYPKGLPPAEELYEKSVDLAILCYASTQNETDYPGFLLEALKTEAGYPQVMMVHWEDFFTDHKGYTREPRLVALTRPKKVRKRWDALGLSPDNVVMPRPGALVTFK